MRLTSHTDNALAHRIERQADDDLRAFFQWDGGEMWQAFRAERTFRLALSLRQIDNGKR